MPLDRSAEDEPMTESQTATLRRLAYEAFEPEAFRRQLSKTEAQRRIDALAAKAAPAGRPAAYALNCFVSHRTGGIS